MRASIPAKNFMATPLTRRTGRLITRTPRPAVPIFHPSSVHPLDYASAQSALWEAEYGTATFSGIAGCVNTYDGEGL